MIPETIPVPEFNNDSLPEWAKGNEDILWLCQRNLAFRANVFGAQSNVQMRPVLRKQARKTRYGE